MAKESIRTISKANDTVEKVSKEIVVYTEQDHLQKVESDAQELYEELKGRLLNMDDDMVIQPKKLYIAFKINKTNICDLELQRKGLKIIVNLKSGELQDSRKIARDISNIGHWGNGSYEIKMNDTEDIDYIVSLVKQSLKKNKS